MSYSDSITLLEHSELVRQINAIVSEQQKQT